MYIYIYIYPITHIFFLFCLRKQQQILLKTRKSRVHITTSNTTQDTRNINKITRDRTAGRLLSQEMCLLIKPTGDPVGRLGNLSFESRTYKDWPNLKSSSRGVNEDWKYPDKGATYESVSKEISDHSCVVSCQFTSRFWRLKLSQTLRTSRLGLGV